MGGTAGWCVPEVWPSDVWSDIEGPLFCLYWSLSLRHSITREAQETVVTRGQLCWPQLLSLRLDPALFSPGSNALTVARQSLHNNFRKPAGWCFHFIPVSNLDCQCEFLFFLVESPGAQGCLFVLFFLYMESCRGSSGAGCVHNSSCFHGGCVSNSCTRLYSANTVTLRNNRYPSWWTFQQQLHSYIAVYSCLRPNSSQNLFCCFGQIRKSHCHVFFIFFLLLLSVSPYTGSPHSCVPVTVSPVQGGMEILSQLRCNRNAYFLFCLCCLVTPVPFYYVFQCHRDRK